MTVCAQGHEVGAGAAFCEECGQDLRPRCEQGHAGRPGDTFCETCGAPLRTAEQAAEPVTALLLDAQDDVDAGAHHGSVPVVPPAPTSYPPPPPPPSPALQAPPPALPPPARGDWPAPVDARPAAPGWPAPAPAGPGGGPGMLPPFHFDLRRLSRVDQLTGAAAAVCLLSLFLPWFSVGGYAHISGLRLHLFLVVAFLDAFLLLAYLAVRGGWDRMPVRLPVAHAPLLLVGAAVLLVLVVIAFLWEPEGFSRTFGAYLALASALGTALPVGLAAAQSVQGSR